MTFPRHASFIRSQHAGFEADAFCYGQGGYSYGRRLGISTCKVLFKLNVFIYVTSSSFSLPKRGHARKSVHLYYITNRYCLGSLHRHAQIIEDLRHEENPRLRRNMAKIREQWLFSFLTQCHTLIMHWKLPHCQQKSQQTGTFSCHLCLHACNRSLFARGLSIDSRACVISQHARWPIRTPCPTCANQDALVVITPKANSIHTVAWRN